MGAIIDYTLTSEADIDKRIANASAAFGALFFYFSLYGNECWR